MRGLKIALVVLVLVNVFALAALGTTLVQLKRVETRLETEHRPGGERRSPRQMLRDMEPVTRDRVEQALRASALAAKPDFEEARRLRREAVAAVSAPEFDAAAVTTLLEGSRAAELRGRQRLERDALALMETLEPQDRARLAPLLARSGRSRGGGRGERPPEAKAD
ncbi:MAG TPA: periplasmic heavy metal sensor [Brevundimonas sp.]|uniref:periplasmic heavy metal sensor n=1 Tax=Brevundimonas sp. TaxID=1871086 RepID=UPI002DF308CC|nr:periplasmic heavy metal sensor [Brevundimonas sp.]